VVSAKTDLSIYGAIARIEDAEVALAFKEGRSARAIVPIDSFQRGFRAAMG
jgi:hypothetical protein